MIKSPYDRAELAFKELLVKALADDPGLDSHMRSLPSHIVIADVGSGPEAMYADTFHRLAETFGKTATVLAVDPVCNPEDFNLFPRTYSNTLPIPSTFGFAGECLDRMKIDRIHLLAWINPAPGSRPTLALPQTNGAVLVAVIDDTYKGLHGNPAEHVTKQGYTIHSDNMIPGHIIRPFTTYNSKRIILASSHLDDLLKETV